MVVQKKRAYRRVTERLWPACLNLPTRAVVIGKRGRQTVCYGPCTIHNEDLPEGSNPLCVLNTVFRRGELQTGFEGGKRSRLCHNIKLELVPVFRLNLVKTETYGKTDRSGGVVVTFQGPSAAEEVDGDEARRLHDMEEAVAVL